DDGVDGARTALCGLFFFFEAEDGIRDWSVTGVQTCALPICCRRRRRADSDDEDDDRQQRDPTGHARTIGRCASSRSGSWQGCSRSEERRVGKEGRGWGGGVESKGIRDWERRRRVGRTG